MITFKEFLGKDMPVLEDVFLSEDGATFQMLQEGKWISGRFENNIRIDYATHGAGQTHAHVYGRKGDEIGVVNLNGSASHGAKCKLHDADADALRARKFEIQAGNLVEWLVLERQPILLLG